MVKFSLWLIFFFLSIFCGSSNDKHSHGKHHLHHFGAHRYISPGNQFIVKEVSVHGAIIVSDHFGDSDMDVANETDSRATEGRQSEEFKKLTARNNNYVILQNQLPFNLTKWSAIVTGACPHYPNGHKTERGLAWAHYRIWRDFIYFDPDVMKSISGSNTTIITDDIVAASADGVYIAYQNKTLVKNQTPYKDEDILVIFEDDAMSVIDDTNTTILEELVDMKVDIVYLGWCEGRTARPVPLCSHAYALTRKSARKLVHYFEPCGRAVDEQFVIIVKNGWLSYRRAHPYSYKILRKDYSPWGDKTYGIFRQCKSQCGSINGH